MTIFERFLGKLYLALHRRMQNRYDAGRTTRTHRQRRDRTSPDAALAPTGPQMRENARNLEANHDLADGVLATLCAKVIGTGLTPEPNVKLRNGDPAVDFNNRLRELWEIWAANCTVTGEMHAHEAQDVSCRSWMRDGEIFDQIFTGDVRGLMRSSDSMRRVPLWIECLEADYFPFDYNDPSKRIVQAVEKNGWARPIAYHKYRQHPGDIAGNFIFSSDLITSVGGFEGLRRVPAERILHTKLVKRHGQTRGVTVFHATMNRFRDVKDYDDYERVAAQVGAALGAVITKNAAMDYTAEDGPKRNLSFEPGMIFDDMRPGEDVRMIGATRPNPELTNFRRDNLRSAAASLGVQFSTIARLYDTSYSAMRQEQVDTDVNYRRLTNRFVEHRERPLWVRFVQTATMGNVSIPRDVDRDTLFDMRVTPPAQPWIDPKKEIEADILALTGGDSRMPLTSWRQLMRKRGMNPQTTIEQIIEEREMFGDLIEDTEDEQTGQTPASSQDGEQAA